MRKIGLIGAMEQEVSIFKEKMTQKKIMKMASMEFCEGKLEGKDVVIVKSGIGKVNAAVCTQILIDLYNISVVINTGIAGSLRQEINIADIVLSKDAIQHDVNAGAFGYELGLIPGMDTLAFEADKELLNKAKRVCQEFLPDTGTHVGRVLTGDQFVADGDKKQWLRDTFDGYCTEMEGAAIAQVTYLNKIPFLIIRSISDKADNSANMDYDEFEKIAIEKTVVLITSLLKEI